jgi:hypothetical protein
MLLLQKQKRSEAPSMKLDDARDTAVVDLLILVQGRRNSSVGRPLRWKVVVATSMIELEEEKAALLIQQKRRSGIVFFSSLSYIDDWPPPPPPPSSSSSYP